MALVALGSFVTRPVSADTLPGGGGLDVRLYRPPVDAHGFLAVNGAFLAAPGKGGVSIVSEIGVKATPIDAEHDLVDVAATSLVGASIALAPPIAVGVALPLQSVSGTVPIDFAPGSPKPEGPYASFRSIGPGDVELNAKVGGAAFGAGPFGFAGVARASLPTGQSSALRGDPGVSLWPSAVLEYAPIGFARAAIEVGYRWVSGRGARVRVAGSQVE
ncbi:MAG TPA: hypothetical protein VIM73_20670, partial [Polyangiaceae bacterium]